MTREIRRQRQRTIIVQAAAAGDLARASALLAEHVIEFPQDVDLLDDESFRGIGAGCRLCESRSMIESADLQTETFTNSQGWTLIRVTHLPTGTSAERERSATLDSSVQAQTQCIEELRERITSAPEAPTEPGEPAPVTREEFQALAARVAALEARLKD